MHVHCSVEDAVARVTLTRAEKLNALTLDTLDALVATGRRLRADRTLRAVVLSGEGRSFCAGLDFASTAGQGRRVAASFVPRPWRGTNTFQEACWVWRRLPVPVVAAVHGHCFGGGVQLALGADYRFTTADARWAVLEVKWGLIPDMSGMRTLAEQVGADVAKRLAMTGEVISGEEAVRLGLASEVAADPVGAALGLVDQILVRSPDAVGSAKLLVDRTRTLSARRAFARERWAQARLFRAPNTAAARRASAAGEPPRFGPRRAP